MNSVLFSSTQRKLGVTVALGALVVAGWCTLALLRASILPTAQKNYDTHDPHPLTSGSTETGAVVPLALPPIKNQDLTPDTRLWTLYRDTSDGFIFRYPPKWRVTDMGNGVSLELSTRTTTCEGECIEPFIGITAWPKSPPSDPSGFLNSEGINPESIEGFQSTQLGGRTAYHVQVSTPPGYSDEIVAYHDGLEFTIINNFASGDFGAETKSLLEVFQGLVATFQFSK